MIAVAAVVLTSIFGVRYQIFLTILYLALGWSIIIDKKPYTKKR